MHPGNGRSRLFYSHLSGFYNSVSGSLKYSSIILVLPCTVIVALAFETPSTFLATHLYRPSSSFLTLSMIRTPSSPRVIPAIKRPQSSFKVWRPCAGCITPHWPSVKMGGKNVRLPGLGFSRSPFLYHVISGRGTPRALHSNLRVLLLFTSWFVKFWVSKGGIRATIKPTSANVIADCQSAYTMLEKTNYCLNLTVTGHLMYV